MIHQLRVYEIFEETKAAFHARFRDHAARIMRRHGFRILGMWEARAERRTEFVYLLEWPDEATMRDAWADIKRATAVAGAPLVCEIEDRLLATTAYSPVLTRA
jgi:heme-degrading monooxygenase HmoA